MEIIKIEVKYMSDTEQTISVVIPFYSGADWLDEALSSVINQEKSVDEIIVVNDGSKEDISSLTKKYNGQVAFYYKDNGGAGSARNYGIQKAKCDIVFFLDSDDIWEKNKTKVQYDLMTNRGYYWSATGYCSFGGEKENVIVPYATEGLCWEHIYNSCRIQTSTVAVRREWFNDKDNLFAEDMRNGQDVYVWFRLAQKHPLGVEVEPFTRFRIRGSNAHLNYITHIRVRALLWKKMKNGLLNMPNRRLTKMGYKICNSIYDKYNGDIPQNMYNKILFGTAWMMFRVSNMIKS